MNVRFSSKLPLDRSAEDQARAQISELMGQLMAMLSIPPDSCTELVVADEESYGSAITEIAEGETFTNTAGYTGVGKTIPLERSSEGTPSVVVIREEMIGRVMGPVQSGESSQDTVFAQKFCLYTIAHELGHCLDNYSRGSNAKLSVDDKGAFNSFQVGMYYVDILLGEFAACAHSSRLMDPDVFDNNAKEFGSGEILTGLPAARATYEDDEDLAKFAFFTSGTFWFVMIEYAKLVGYLIGNPQLGTLPSTWKVTGSDSSNHFKDLRECLVGLWSTYPKWEIESVRDSLMPVWRGLAESNRYRFVSLAGGDSLYF